MDDGRLSPGSTRAQTKTPKHSAVRKDRSSRRRRLIIIPHQSRISAECLGITLAAVTAPELPGEADILGYDQSHQGSKCPLFSPKRRPM